MKDSTICFCFAAACATAIAVMFDGEIAYLVAGGLITGTSIAAYERVRGV